MGTDPTVGRARVQTLALPLPCSGIVGESLNLSVPQFLHLENEITWRAALRAIVRTE